MLVLPCQERGLVGGLEPLAGDSVADLLHLLGATEVPRWRGRRRLLRSVLENGGLEVLSLVTFSLAVGEEPFHDLAILVGLQVLGSGAGQPGDPARLEHCLAVGAGKLPLLWDQWALWHPVRLDHLPLECFHLLLDLARVGDPGVAVDGYPLEFHAGDGRERRVLYLCYARHPRLGEDLGNTIVQR